MPISKGLRRCAGIVINDSASSTIGTLELATYVLSSLYDRAYHLPMHPIVQQASLSRESNYQWYLVSTNGTDNVVVSTTSITSQVGPRKIRTSTVQL